MNKWIKIAAVVAVLAVASSAQAVPMTAPAQVAPVVTTVAPWGSLTLVDQMTSNFGGPLGPGSVTSMVYKEAGGTLDFFYQVTSQTSHATDRVSITGYTGFTTDMLWVHNTGILPAPASGSPGTVGFDKFTRLEDDVVAADFAFPGLANGTSDWIVVRTNATSYAKNEVFLQDGAHATATAFSPAPLPSSLVLFATGAMGMVGGLFRRLRRLPM